MDNEELKKKIDEQGIKIDAIYKSVEKTRKYFLMIIWVTVIAVVVPIIGLVFAIPAFMNNYVGSLSGLDSSGGSNPTSVFDSIKELGL
jgi:hypothetical protein